MDRKTYKKKSKGRRLRKRAVFILLPFILIAAAAISYSGYLYVKAQGVANDSYEEVNGREQSDKREEAVNPDVDNVSILFLGVDESESRSKNASGNGEGSTSRTDAMILATLNNEDKSVKLLSIPRDTLTYIPEVQYEDKINHAHAFGGPKASMEAVEELLDVPVDYYVRMNFYAFMDVVEALDGVRVDVPFDMQEMDSEDGNNAITLQEGNQLLNGEEALAFARSRSYDSDLARGGRQLEIMEAIMDRATSVGSINKYSDVIEAVGDNMQTNMRFSEMRSFISYAANSNLSVNMQTLQGDGAMYNGVYYYEPYEEELMALQADLRNHLDLPVLASNTTSDWEESQNSDDNREGSAQEDQTNDSEW